MLHIARLSVRVRNRATWTGRDKEAVWRASERAATCWKCSFCGKSQSK